MAGREPAGDGPGAGPGPGTGSPTDSGSPPGAGPGARHDDDESRHPAHEIPRRITDVATVVLCDNPGEMTFEGTNTYLLRAPGSESCVVVDPGPEHDRHHDVVAAASGSVELVLITHRHEDHTGGIDQFVALTGAPVRALLPDYCRDAEPLAAGEVVRAAGLELTVLATPGHTADSLSVLVAGESEEALDSIVLGDTILGRDSAVLDSRDGDLGDYLSSLDALAAHGRGVVGLPGHGPEVEDTAAAAEHYARHRRERLDQIRAARAELGADADAAAITAHIYTDVSPFLRMVAEQSTEVALRYLDRAGE